MFSSSFKIFFSFIFSIFSLLYTSLHHNLTIIFEHTPKKMVFINQLRKPMWVLVVVVAIATGAFQTTGSSTSSSSSGSIRISDSKSIYEELEKNKLPKGLFPKGVTNFTIDEYGQFEAHLDQTCLAKLEDPFMFTQSISGNMSEGQIQNMTGVQTEHLFVWLKVRDVQILDPKSGLIEFYAGGVHKQFPLSVFETPPNCVAVASPPPGTQKMETTLQYRRFSKKKSGSGVM